MSKPKGLFVLPSENLDRIYGPDERRDVRELADIYAPPQAPNVVKANSDVLGEVEIIMSGWGGARMDEAFLAAAPNLKAVFYGAGTIRSIVSDAFWDSGITVTSAYAANSVPVAEFILSQILFCLKRGWQFALQVKQERAWPKPAESVPGAGGYLSTVGLVSLGMIGRRVLELLKPFDLDILVFSTSLTPERAQEMGVELCPLEDVFRRSDVVSLHTALLPQTTGMITGEHIAAMKEGATFINTARGAVVREKEMIEALRRRPDLLAVLDVTDPEPPEPGSPLYTLPNVIMTPHIAGSQGNECRRMGRYAVEELRRYVNGEPLQWQITKEKFERMA